MFKKLFILALLTFGLSAAFAQTDGPLAPTGAPEQYWAGLSTGFPFGVTFHFGLNDALTNNADVRFIGSIFGDRVGLGADALYGFGISGEDALDLYVGGGPVLSIGNKFAAGINALAGLEYRLSALDFAPGGVFVEVGPFLGFGDETFIDLNARLGFNYHF